MRNISSNSIALLTSGQQIEPVILLSIQWVPNGNTIWYSTKATTDGNGNVITPGKIIDVTPFQESQRSDSSGLAGALSVTLDDRDGALKSIFDTTDIHLKIARVYQWFWGLNDSEKFLIFAGQVSTPIEWDEGKRTLKFDIVTKIEDQEVGWSAEMDPSNELISPDMIGLGWPMIFGTVVHAPGTQLDIIPTAFTQASFGLVDQTLGIQLANLENLLQEAILATEYFSNLAASQDPTDPLDFENRVANDPQVQQYTQMQAQIQDQITQIKETETWQDAAVGAAGSVPLIPTTFIRHDKAYDGLFRVNNLLFQGHLSKWDGWINGANPVPAPGSPAGSNLRAGFQFFPAGTAVVAVGPYPIEYMVSCVPGTVLQVWGMRSWNGIKRLAPLPTDWYTVRQVTSGPLTFTTIILSQALSIRSFLENLKTQTWENNFGQQLPAHIVNQVEWEDQIYVTFQSAVGPNAVDIMIWLIDSYCPTNTYDSTSFNHVKGLVANMPMNFSYSERRNVLDVLTEIAYQARCIIYLRDDVFYLLYLPEEPTAVDTITEDDVLVDSLVVTTTPTESLVTKYVATFKPDYSPFFERPVTVILRYNIAKYGIHEEDHDFFCYNNFYAVEKAATFWMIRKAQTWKILKCKLLLTKINLEVFDTVTLGFSHPYIANGPVKGLITNCQYNSSDHTIDVEIWTPVLLGTMTANKFGWPSGLTEQDVWPQYHDIGAGAGTSINGGYQGNQGMTGRPPIGVYDSLNYAEQGLGAGLELRPTWTSGDPLPGDATGYYPTLMPSVTDDIQRPKMPVKPPDPTKDYSYQSPPDPSIPDKQIMIPARVQAYMGKDQNNSNLINYKMEVYTQGLQNQPQLMTVGQLQISPDDRIPVGSWTFININQIKTANGNQVSERTMQFPVWLQ